MCGRQSHGNPHSPKNNWGILFVTRHSFLPAWLQLLQPSWYRLSSSRAKNHNCNRYQHCHPRPHLHCIFSSHPIAGSRLKLACAPSMRRPTTRWHTRRQRPHQAHRFGSRSLASSWGANPTRPERSPSPARESQGRSPLQ